jgi:hypothetical protein
MDKELIKQVIFVIVSCLLIYAAYDFFTNGDFDD